MKILVIRFSSLGDIVLLTPLFQKIKQRYPSSHLSFLTGKKYAALFTEDPNIDRIIPYTVLSENTVQFLRLLRTIRNERYDLIIDCHSIPRSILLYLFGRSKERRRINKFSFARRMMVKTHRVKKLPHIVTRYLATIDDEQEHDYKPKLYLKQDEIEKYKKLFNRNIGTRKIIGFVIGASRKTKMWQEEKLKNLSLDLVRKDNVFIVFLGGKSEVELVNRIKEGLGDKCLDLSGKTDLRELSAALTACDVLFTTDSGPMHVAIAVGTPVVTIFGPTVPEFGFSPYDEKSIIISKTLSCKPCSLHGTDRCPLGHHNCMKLIEVEEVREGIAKLLHKNTRML